MRNSEMDDLDRSIVERRALNPRYPQLLDAEVRRQELVGELVRIRRRAHLTQTQVARRMGVTQSVVAEIESGEIDVRFTTLDRYVAALGNGRRISIT